jgi:hypothetical protein
MEEQNRELDKQIQIDAQILADNARELERRDLIIQELKRENDLTQRQVRQLQQRLAQFEADFANMTDDELLLWISRFVKPKKL